MVSARSGQQPDQSVFINCPFDPAYDRFFSAIALTAYCCGIKPVCALTQVNGASGRLELIKKWIFASEFSIHELTPPERFLRRRPFPFSLFRNPTAHLSSPRLNMAFELGLTLGASFWGNPDQQAKTALILIANQTDLQQGLSDISYRDPAVHQGNLEILIEKVHLYLDDGQAPGRTWPHEILRLFEEFWIDLPSIAKEKGWNPARFNIRESHHNYIVAMEEYLSGQE